MASALTCPVCKSSMREVEREGVTIDVCTQCRGVWLDRGELEKLSGLVSSPRRSSDRDDDHDNRRWRDDDDDRFDHRRSDERYRDHKKKSGMTRFLDFFD